MKRLSKFMVVLFCFLCLSGCTKVQDLTDHETKVIAEYAADLLLKYDISFDDRISEGEYKLKKQEERGQTVTTEAVFEETTEEITTEEMTTENRQGEFVSGTIGDMESVQDDSSASSVTDIATIIGQDDLSITYHDYIITDQYPATDEDGKFIYLEASEGYDLLVLRFQIKNKTSHVCSLSLLNEKIDYKIVCNGNKAAKPMLTILMDDLSTLETTIESEGIQDAVLVFQVSDALKDKLETIQLYVDYNGSSHVMNIQ
ncbi:MAG: hypothetical protein ACI4F4_05100 [Lachnospiraceae bacterium]